MVEESDMKKAAIGAIFFLLSATVAGAQSARNAVLRFGLFGTWAPSCSEQPAPGNSHTIFSVTSLGATRVQNDFGNDYDDMIYDIVAADRISVDRLALREILVSDPRVVLDMVMLKADDRIRIWSSREAGGALLVVQGTFPDTSGQQTRWAARCNERRAAPPQRTMPEPEIVPSASGIVFKPGQGR
jgi:hypothetical protein